MLHLGNGDHSQAQILDRVTRLLKLYEKMGGLQQPQMSTMPALTKAQELQEDEAWLDLKFQVQHLMADLRTDFDLQWRS